MIQSEPESIERIRARIRKMTDRELREYGRDAARMADPSKNRNPNPSLQIQLDEARAEWRRRHGKHFFGSARSLAARPYLRNSRSDILRIRSRILSTSSGSVWIMGSSVEWEETGEQDSTIFDFD